MTSKLDYPKRHAGLFRLPGEDVRLPDGRISVACTTKPPPVRRTKPAPPRKTKEKR